VEAIVLGYWVIVAFIVLAFYQHLPASGMVLGMQVALLSVTITLVVLIRRLPARRQTIVRFLIMSATMPFAYLLLGEIIPFVNPLRPEARLIRIDHQIFGVNPQEWIERYYHPVLTEILQVVYATFYYLPLLVALLLLKDDRIRDLDEFMTAVAAGFLSGFLIYIMVPVRSPYIFAETAEGQFMLNYRTDLQGIMLTERIRESLHSMEMVKHDCFPSGHTLVSLIVLIYSFRMVPRAAWALLPVVSALIFSTVYLRYHYVIDLLAGGVLALVVVYVAPWLTQAWDRRFGPVEAAPAVSEPEVDAPDLGPQPAPSGGFGGGKGPGG
jgi:hypothetical protein